jgi:primosomal protein N' (replication factor Y)
VNKNPKSPIARVVLFKQAVQPLDYLIPAALVGRVEPGMRVLVPVRNREAVGMIVGLAERPEVASVRPIESLLDDSPLVDTDFLDLSRRVSDYYLSGLGPVIRSGLPPGLDAAPRVVYRSTEAGRHAFHDSTGLPDRQRTVLGLICRQSAGRRGLSVRTIRRRTGRASASSVLQTLLRKGWIEQRILFPGKHRRSAAAAVGTDTGSKTGSLFPPADMFGDILRLFDDPAPDEPPNTFCIRGSLLDSLYPSLSALASECGRRQRGALFLVPEVSQVRPLSVSLAGELGHPVAVYHGDLSPGVRTATWRAIASGEFPVVVGTRSAVFAPVRSLGLIVVCLEEDPSHKAEESPHYHVREVALMRGEVNRVPVCLTSVSQSIETHNRCRTGRHRLLNAGVEEKPPRVSIVDMKSSPPGRILSDALSEAVSRHLRLKKPLLLLLNRKGYSTAILCRECGHVFRCPQCGVSLIYHQQLRKLICHYCGLRQRPPAVCPTCKGTRIGGIGTGTEQVEEMLHRAFPGIRTLRVEGDHPPGAGKRADIYLGTEWIYRWGDLPDTPLAAVLDADTYLYSPDFYAGEKTFHFIGHVLARTARSGGPGSEVIIQTRYPDHAAIAWAGTNDPELFYRSELFERKVLGYPPFKRLVEVIMKSRREAEASRMAHRIKNRLAGMLQEENGVRLLGPAPAPLSPLRGMYRFILLIKGPADSSLQDALRGAFRDKDRGGESAVTVIVDPMGIR